LPDSEHAAGFALPDDDTGEVAPESESELAAALQAFQADDRTPNEDDTAVMRRAWAWADEEAPVAKDAKPVDLGPDPFVRPPVEPAAPTGRKPARVRLRYPDTARLGEEYRENLRKGGTFVKTAKPLAVGRECICEVSAPGLDDTLLFPAVVTFVATSAPGQDAGMGIEYRLSDAERRSVERIIDRL
jgi:type IV pilus assembly protein PilZ